MRLERHRPTPQDPAQAPSSDSQTVHLSSPQGEVDKAVRGMWSGTLKRRALLLSALGRSAGAEKQIDAAVERYPQSWLWSLLRAEVRWRAGDFEGAALALAKPTVHLSYKAWEESVPEYFLLAFKNRPGSQAATAIKALAPRLDDPWLLTKLGKALGKKGEPFLETRGAFRWQRTDLLPRDRQIPHQSSLT